MAIKLISGAGISKKGIQMMLDIEKIAYNKQMEVFSKKNFRIIINPVKEKVKGAVKLETRFGLINLPINEVYKADKADVLNYMYVNDKKMPAVVKDKNDILFLFDIGKIFFSLLSNSYYEKEKIKHVLSNPFLEKLYKKIPYWIRIRIYRRYYQNLHNKLNRVKGFKTDFPVDKTAYALLDLFVSLLDGCTKIMRWPPGYDHACLISHDTEPTKYSYIKGMDIINRAAGNRKTTMSVVGKYFKDYGKNMDKDFIVHGWVHDKNFLSINSRERFNRIKRAKEEVEKKINKKVIGFRAPALQISDDLFDILKKAGYKYDSSYIDIQREEPNTGRGISINLPYYMDGFLEIPTTAPDCISPYYFGHSMKKTLSLFSQKLAWVEKTNQLANFIVHAPAWGKKDAEKRIMLLKYLVERTQKKNCFCTDCFGMYDWWSKRANVVITKNAIINNNKEDIKVVVCKDNKKKIINLKECQKRRL